MATLRFVYLFIFSACFARDPLTVDIPNQGKIVGKMVDPIRTKKIRAYLGIPYAHPPLQTLRFAPPVTDPLPSWTGVRNATNYAAACLQSRNEYASPFFKLLAPRTYKVKYSEDCLYLNVFVPTDKSPPDGFATIVWLHPGNFTSGNPALWDPYTLVYRHKVLVVTLAYRLHILGFFSTLDGEATGNYGILDQQAAMLWVKNNIRLFDGNPDNICLMGYGSGAVSVGLHMTMPLSQTLFSKAIAMSGNFLDPSVVGVAQEGRQLMELAAQRVGCELTPTPILLRCLRNPSAEDLVRLTTSGSWRPIIDAGLSNSTPALIGGPLKDTFFMGDFHKVPFLTGYTNMESVLSLGVLQNENITNDVLEVMLGDIIIADLPILNASEGCFMTYEHAVDSVVFYYVPATPINGTEEARKLIVDFKTEKDYGSSSFLHASFVSNYNDTYMYRFDIKPSTKAATADLPDWVSVPHLYDLIYVFGMPFWVEFPNKTQEWDDRDKSIADTIMRLWTNFAKYSYPTKNSYAVNWELFDNADPKLLVIDNNFIMRNSTNFNFKAFEFWNDYFPKVLEVSKQCCNASSTGEIIRNSAVPVVFLVIALR